jgi:hypothetical protein
MSLRQGLASYTNHFVARSAAPANPNFFSGTRVGLAPLRPSSGANQPAEEKPSIAGMRKIFQDGCPVTE